MFAAIKGAPELRMQLHRDAAASAQPQVSEEDEQLQWAIRQSMLEAKPQQAPAMQVPAQAQGSAAVAAASETSKADAAANSFMEASDVQKLLEAAEAREAQVAAERSELKQALAENESLIKGLTDQLDSVNGQLRERVQ
eukprot:851085-Amphidinium_carterae.1